MNCKVGLEILYSYLGEGEAVEVQEGDARPWVKGKSLQRICESNKRTEKQILQRICESNKHTEKQINKEKKTS